MAYIDFRFALKESELLARGNCSTNTLPILEAGKKEDLASAPRNARSLHRYRFLKAGKSQLELRRDEASVPISRDEDKTYQLAKDIAENLENRLRRR